jgi:hypothetical protein
LQVEALPHGYGLFIVPRALRSLQAGSDPPGQRATSNRSQGGRAARDLLWSALVTTGGAFVRVWHQVAQSALVQQALQAVRVAQHLRAFTRDRLRADNARSVSRQNTSGVRTPAIGATAIELQRVQMVQLRRHLQQGTLETFVGQLERTLVLVELFKEGVDLSAEDDEQAEWHVAVAAQLQSAVAECMEAERRPWLLARDLLVARCAAMPLACRSRQHGSALVSSCAVQ